MRPPALTFVHSRQKSGPEAERAMTQNTTLLVATVKNEGPNILEWVAHHRLCGFDRIQIYQNDSFDTTLPILRTLDRLGVIEYHTNRHAKGAFQTRAYKRASRSETYANSDWCMVLDGDEFLNVRTDGQDIGAVLQMADRADAVEVQTRLFGSNGHSDISADLVTERFTMAQAASDLIQASACRVLFRTDCFGRADISGPSDPMRDDLAVIGASETRALAQVNHYALRDLQSFVIKRARGPANGQAPYVDQAYWVQHDRNDVLDRGLADRATALWGEMQRLDALSDGKLMRLRRRGIRQWRQTAKLRMQEPAYAALIDAIQATVSGDKMGAGFTLPKGQAPVFQSTRSRLTLQEDPAHGWAAE